MQIELNLKRALIGAGVILAIALGLVLYATGVRSSYESRIVSLQNQVAERDHTLEVKEGVFQKLAVQDEDLKRMLDEKDEEVVRLKNQLDQQGAQLLTANTLIVKLRKDLQSTGNVVIEHPDPKYPDMIVAKLDSKNDFDPFRVTGDVVVDCGIDQPDKTPQSSLKMSQTRPFKFSVVVSQDKDGTWRSSTTSSEKNFQVDIALAAVNPYVLEPKWYEKIGLDIEAGVGTNPGLLGGVGATYRVGKFDVGPKVWVVIDRGVSPYFGAQLSWHPFAK